MKGLAFIGVAAVLFAAVGVGWVAHNRDSINSLTSIVPVSEVAVGVDGPAPQTLDIRKTPGKELDQALLGNVYETLVGRDQDNNLVPSVAKGWDVSKDGLTYTFDLHSDMRFSNGDAMDSSDVVYSLQQVIDGSYVGAEDLSGIAQVRNPNTSTVVLTLNSPNPRLLRALSSRAGIVYDSSAKIDYAKQALGSGPFTLRTFEPGNSIKLVRNTLYWQQQSASSQVRLHYYDSADSMRSAMKDGEIQMAVLQPAESPKPYQKNDKYNVAKGESTVKVMLALNNGTNSIFSDERARKAARYILDTTSLVKSQPSASATLGGPIGPLEPGYEDLNSLYPHNLSEGENDINYFSSAYLGSATFLVPEEYTDLGNQITKQFAPSRFNLNMQVVNDATLRQRINNGDYTLAITTMDGTDDASQFANDKFGYQNGDAQQLYRNALAATNDTDYQSALKTYAKAVSLDAASAWLYNESSTVVTTKKVTGAPRNMTDQLLPLRDVLTK